VSRRRIPTVLVHRAQSPRQQCQVARCKAHECRLGMLQVGSQPRAARGVAQPGKSPGHIGKLLRPKTWCSTQHSHRKRLDVVLRAAALQAAARFLLLLLLLLLLRHPLPSARWA
jgi:hypothetical protein